MTLLKIFVCLIRPQNFTSSKEFLITLVHITMHPGTSLCFATLSVFGPTAQFRLVYVDDDSDIQALFNFRLSGHCFCV